jgi:exodeoxyribonuclease V gamma subunit
VLVSELLDYLAQGYELPGQEILKDHILVRHRLQAFSPVYFRQEDPRLFSFSAENCQASYCGQQQRVAPTSFFDQPLGEPEADWKTVDVMTLAEFFCHPARWVVTRRLGLRFEEMDQALEGVEPFGVDYLDGYAIRQELVELSLKGASFEDALKLTKASGRLPLGEAGAAYFRQLQSDVQAFLQVLRPHLGDGYADPTQVDHRSGEFRVIGEIRLLTAAGSLHYRCASIKAEDRLRLWIQHVLLSAAFPDGRYGRAVLVGSDEVAAFPPVAEAHAVLSNLLDLYWQGLRQPLKFFPQTSLAYVQAAQKPGSSRARDPMSAAWLSWDGNPFNGAAGECEDDYYDLCFRHQNPLDEEFQRIALSVFGPQLAVQKEALI